MVKAISAPLHPHDCLVRLALQLSMSGRKLGLSEAKQFVEGPVSSSVMQIPKLGNQFHLNVAAKATKYQNLPSVRCLTFSKAP